MPAGDDKEMLSFCNIHNVIARLLSQVNSEDGLAVDHWAPRL